MKLRRMLAVTACGALLATGACSGGDPKTQATEPGRKPGQKITLTFWAWVPGIDKAVDLWNKENPEVQVKLSEIPAGDEGGYQKMRAALKGGNPPDLAQLEYEAVPGFVLDGGLQDLGPYGADQAKSKFVDWQWQQGVFDGKQHVIPQASGPMAMFYREDLLKKWGIEPPKTWAEFKDAAKKVREHDAYITTFSPTSSGWFSGLNWQAGARWFGTQGDTWTVDIDNQQTRKVAAYWDELIKEDLVATVSDGSDEYFKDLQDGKLATVIGASWGDAILKGNAGKTEGKWRVAPMPQWTPGGKVAGNFGGSVTAPLKGGKYPAEAVKFAVWLNTDPDSVDLLIEGGYGWPAAKDVFRGSALDKADPFFGGQRYNEVFAQADAGVDKSWRWMPTFSETAAHLTDGFKGAVGGQGTLVDVIASTDKQTVEDLQQKGLKAATK